MRVQDKWDRGVNKIFHLAGSHSKRLGTWVAGGGKEMMEGGMGPLENLVLCVLNVRCL